MLKRDYKKEMKHLYRPSSRVGEVTVPEIRFLMIDGAGDPNTSIEFQNAIQGLFPIAYNLKFMTKRGELGIDYGVFHLKVFGGVTTCGILTLR